MKRGKEDEKGMGPMFPRLHVNDTEKGGPRAPPRNKMALYEQFTVPSQRYNSGALPPNHSNSSKFVPSTSTIQGTGRERNVYFPVYRPPLATSYDEHQARHPEGVSSSNQPEQVDRQRKSPKEDDFSVPIFSQAGIGLCNEKIQNSVDGERHAHLSHGDKDPNWRDSENLVSRKHAINQDGRNMGVFRASLRYSDTLTREKVYGRLRTEKGDTCLRQEVEASVLPLDPRYGKDASVQPLERTQEDISLSLNHNPRTGFVYRDANEGGNGVQRAVNVERGDDVSVASMVDCTSGVYITPDDVVGVLGRKHFWKARTAIVNQQRVFAVQVFELHRLIKVQKLIAGSPHLLLETTALLNKASLNRTPMKQMKQYSSDYAHIKHKNDFQKLSDKLEGTAENAIAKAPIPPSPQNTIQPSGYQPSPTINITDPKMNSSWDSFPQPTGHQWLVPVMSHSEGLVYKPYPGPAFAGGGYGPPFPMPYGAPTPQGTGGMPFGGQGYFFPYGMPPMVSPAGSASVVDQTNPYTGPNPYGQTGNLVNPTIQQQGSCNMPTQKIISSAFQAPPPKEAERQGSSASSTCEREILPLFPTAPTSETENQSTRVIRVVPRNPVSSRESAARIFQSIEEERQRHGP